MFSLTLAKNLVYGALGLSMLCALATVVAVLWWTARVRRPRWSWALAAPIVVCAPAGWIWLYPSFVIGAVAGGELGAQVGHHLSPTADATLMAIGIGLGTYVVFTAPMALLVLLVGIAVTAPHGSSESDRQMDAVRPVRIGSLVAVGAVGARAAVRNLARAAAPVAQ